MKKIIIPTDFSINAQKAIDYALRLFKSEACMFYIIHAFHDAPSSESSKATTQKNLNVLIEKLKSQYNTENYQFEGILKTDSVLNLTNKIITEKSADYVFMGTKGTSALRQFLVGSNTLDLIKYLENCPLMIIPSEYDCNSTQEIVFATDYKHTFTSIELKPLIQMVSLCKATLNIAYIKTSEHLSEIQEKNKESLRNSLNQTRHLFFQLNLQDTVADTLHKIEKENKNIGLISILKTKHGFFQQLTRENIVKNITFKTKIPLLVLPQIK